VQGKHYCVGVGPGDPELMTLKAVRMLKECDVIAVPMGDNGAMTAREIISKIIAPGEKQEIIMRMPMSKQKAIVARAHQEAAASIKEKLERGLTVVSITLGCPTVYATCIYVHKVLRKAGYDSQIVPGVTSFCAAAARLNIALVEEAEPLVVIPGSYPAPEELLSAHGTKVIMKSGRELGKVIEVLQCRKLLDKAAMVERCGLQDEKVYRDLRQANKDAGYFSLLLVKEKGLENK